MLSIGPTLWLVIVNGLLLRLAETEASAIQAFADGIFVLERYLAVYRFAKVSGSVITEIHRWRLIET